MTVTGRDVLRAALRSRKLGFGNIGRELGISTNANRRTALQAR